MSSEPLTAKSAGMPQPFKTAKPLNESEWTVLIALMDAILPSIKRASKIEGKPGLSEVRLTDARYSEAVEDLRRNTVVLDHATEQDLEDYLADRPSDHPVFQETLRGMLASLSSDGLQTFARVLGQLNTVAGCLFVSGQRTPIPQLSIIKRTAILQKWSTSYIYKLRMLYDRLLALGRLVFTATNPHFAKMSGLPSVAEERQSFKGHQYDFMQFAAASNPIELETDIVIVGSGCGAAVCAENLSEAGHRVLIIEKGYYYGADSLPMSSGDAIFDLMEGAFTTGSDDGSVSVLAASCFGGGGTTSWNAVSPLPDYVRQEWIKERGLDFFATQGFNECHDRISARLCGQQDAQSNHGNQMLLEGAAKLGFTTSKIAQADDGQDRATSKQCGIGCPAHAAGWLSKAAEAGSHFIEGCKVEQILLEGNRAVGVRAVWTSRSQAATVDGSTYGNFARKLVVKAKKVIISAGTLWSPLILQASGLKNPWIGKNLHLHPVYAMHGVFSEDVRPWEGAAITASISDFESLDQKGHGVTLASLSMLPCFAFSFLNWQTGVDFKLQALKYRHTNSYVAMVRDRDSGSIVADPLTGQPRIAYIPSAFDRNHAMLGLAALAKILFVQGAREIHAGLPGIRPFIRDSSLPAVVNRSEDDPRFVQWLADLLKLGNRSPETVCTSAHQMGTNRMSAAAKDGVVDERGRVWGVDNLYVSDASVLPSAVGTNPMMTIMAVSEWISQGILKDMADSAELPVA